MYFVVRTNNIVWSFYCGKWKKDNSQITLRFSIWETGEMELPYTETEKTMENEN